MAASRAASPGAQPDDEPRIRRRLSWPRLGLVVLVVAAITAGVFVSVTRADGRTPTPAKSWSVPYVDVTLTPTFQFQDPAANPARTVALAFVVADPKNGCSPSWGGAYSLDAAGTDLELDRRIAQLRAAGGEVMVSLGGQANDELAVTCQDTGALTDAYRAVIDRYDLGTIDVDIEGAAITDSNAAARRAGALATLQRERAAEHRPLAVWLTLPVTPTGLSAEAKDLVRATLAGGVQLAGVNVMTMDFGTARPAAQSMTAATEQAVTSTVAQVRAVWAEHGTPLSEVAAWAHVGATPMIGQNDVDSEVFTLTDMQQLAAYATANGLGRVSLWSLNRDTACSATFPGVVVHSTTCSGVKQKALAFVNAFGDLGSGGPAVHLGSEGAPASGGTVVDNPATSPFPIWRPEGQYPGGYRVVWHGEVYETRWYAAAGIDPSLPASVGSPSPWALLGAVTTTDVAPKPVPTVADVTTPWDPSVLYQRGDRVLFTDLPYEARWASRDTPPGTLFPIGPDEAWAPLFSLPGEPAGS